MALEETDNLKLPFIMPSQAQKHVPVNEAMRALDALVQLAVSDRHLAVPPALPTEGERFIVGPGAGGDWAGRTGQVAAFQDGAWLFYQPQPGWLCWAADELALLCWNGSAWTEASGAVSVLQSVSRFGLGTVADAPNPFAAKLNKVLWTARTVGEGGDGDLRYTLNKETAGDVLSFLLQTGYSGRAELGLVGDDNLTLKVSANGSAWSTALSVDAASGSLSTVNPVFVNHLGLNHLRLGPGGRFAFIGGANAYVANNSYFDAGSDQFKYVAAGAAAACRMDVNGDFAILTAASGIADATVPWFTRLTLTNAGELQMGGANTVIDANRHHRLRAYTVATLPAAGGAGQVIFCSDLGGGGGALVSDGSIWRRTGGGGHQTVSSDASFTLTALASAEDQRHTGTLTADRMIALSAIHAHAGARFRVTRTGGGAFNLSLGGLKNLATNGWAEVVHDGSAWTLAASGTL